MNDYIKVTPLYGIKSINFQSMIGRQKKNKM